MSKVVVLLHFADPSFFPCWPRPPKKLTWGEMKKKARQTVGAIFCRPSGARAAAPPQCRRRLTAEKTVETIFAFCITHLIFSCRQAPAPQPCSLRPLGSDEDTKAKPYVILIVGWMRQWPCYVLLPNKNW